MCRLLRLESQERSVLRSILESFASVFSLVTSALSAPWLCRAALLGSALLCKSPAEHGVFSRGVFPPTVFWLVTKVLRSGDRPKFFCAELLVCESTSTTHATTRTTAQALAAALIMITKMTLAIPPSDQ